MNTKKECGQATEVYSRVVGYYRPIQNWNKGKKEEFEARKTFTLNERTVSVTRVCDLKEQSQTAVAC